MTTLGTFGRKHDDPAFRSFPDLCWFDMGNPPDRPDIGDEVHLWCFPTNNGPALAWGSFILTSPIRIKGHWWP